MEEDYVKHQDLCPPPGEQYQGRRQQPDLCVQKHRHHQQEQQQRSQYLQQQQQHRDLCEPPQQHQSQQQSEEDHQHLLQQQPAHLQQEYWEEEGEAEDKHPVWLCAACTFPYNEASSHACSMCCTLRPGFSWLLLTLGGTPFPSFPICGIRRAVWRAICSCTSGALTGTFALVGACIGAVSGVLASRTTESGILRGAGLGAITGAILLVEVLEASRLYWHCERFDASSGSSSPPSLGDFIEDLISGRFMQEFVLPAVLAAQRWQSSVDDWDYEDGYDTPSPQQIKLKGATEDFLKTLPRHVVTQRNHVNTCGDVICCAICLQELGQGDISRTLPTCKHTFHLSCVDRWLLKHISCPICRESMGS